MKTVKILLSLIIITLIFTFCRKKETPPDPAKPTPYFISITDAPGPYTAVNIDLQSVEITGNGQTVVLNTNPGIYNLLNFANGVDTLIATGGLTIDKVQQIRLILGPNNSVVSGGVTYSMDVPSGSESGLKLQVHHTLQAGVAYHVLLDFDAYQSVVEEGNGSYHLKPVIRTVQTAISGAIKGILSQPGVSAVISAKSNGITYTTIADANGNFIFSGLPPGTYSVTVTPVSPYNSSTISNITVTVGVTNSLGVITI